MANRCCVCQSDINGTSWTCAKCRIDLSLSGPFKDWPGWVKAMHDIERRRRKVERQEEGRVFNDDVDRWDDDGNRHTFGGPVCR